MLHKHADSSRVGVNCTFKQRSDVPHVDAAGLHELSESDLQEEDWDSSDKDDEQVRDKEHTWRRFKQEAS